MRIYSITSVTLDFFDEIYLIDEEKEARDAIEDLKTYEIDIQGGAKNEKLEIIVDSVGTNGIDCDYEINSHSGRMLVIKLRMFDIDDREK